MIMSISRTSDWPLKNNYTTVYEIHMYVIYKLKIIMNCHGINSPNDASLIKVHIYICENY